MTEPRQRKSWPPKDSPRGVVCPRCGCADLRVLNTRYQSGRIVRYRQCRHCGRRVTTYEVTPAQLASMSSAEGDR
jgi:transcriptional regulator NrdR family protein